jgi:branched-chain amino acid transport system substrate-binding protein
VELRGDEALCVFDSPRQALRAAIALQQRLADAIREDTTLPLRVGIGLEAGEAVLAEDGYRGGALNLAARLCSLARPGEVLAGDGIVLMAGQVDGLDYSDRGRVRVKGISNPVRVHKLEFELDLPAAPAAARGRMPRRAAIAGIALALIAAGAGAFLLLQGSDAPAGVAGDSAALLDPQSGDIRSETAVGATPIDVVSDPDTAWTLDGDAQTISRVTPDGGRALTKAPGFTPASLSLGHGVLWASYVERRTAGTHAGVAALDPSTLTPRMQRLLPGPGPNIGDNPPILDAGGAVWIAGPDDQLRKLDPVSLRTLRTTRLGMPAGNLAFGLGSIWATTGRSLLRVDRETLKVTQRISLATPDTGPVAVGASSVWVGDPLTGNVWRIEPGPPVQTHTVAAGLSANGIAFGDGALWGASAVDGKVFRIDAATEEVESFEVGNAPVDVSVSPAGVWTAVTAGGGRTIESAPKLEGLETLPAGTCDSAVYGGSESPDVLIVADLPMQRFDAPVTLAMVQAIEFVLRQRGFRAGQYNIALQSCDDATVPEASYTEEKCAANAKRYAATPSVIAVIGPYNSGCASAQIGIANRADPGPLPIISPTASYVGLTKSAPGVTPGDPKRYYPTGMRNFARVYPPDDMQGAADAVLAKRLGVRHPYVFLDDPNDGYGATLAQAFATAAKRLGLDVVGPESPRPRDGFQALAERLKRERADGVFVGGLSNDRTVEFIRAMRRGLGTKAVIIAPDAFLPAAEQERNIGPEAIGMYVSGGVVTRPDDQLPAAGREFVRKFRATQRGRPVDFYAPYAAQSAEVLLKAIAHSDGTRESVTRELLRVRLPNGIFGPFAFDKNGDPTESLQPIFRVKKNAPGALYPDDPVERVIPAPAQLVR